MYICKLHWNLKEASSALPAPAVLTSNPPQPAIASRGLEGELVSLLESVINCQQVSMQGQQGNLLFTSYLHMKFAFF